MSPIYIVVSKGKKAYSTDGSISPHYQYARGDSHPAPGRADGDPQAMIFLAGKPQPIGALWKPGTPTVRERNPANITWEGPLVIPSNAPATETDGSILIQNRNFRSTDPYGSPAIYNQSNRLVRIVNCNVFGYGGSGNAKNIICSDAMNSRVEVRNTIGFSGNPGVAGCFAGRMVSSQYFLTLNVINCESYGTTGFAGVSSSAGATLSIRQNVVRNLDGRVSSGSGTYRTGNTWGAGASSDFVIANLIQLDTCRGVVGEVAYNDVVSNAGESRFEDLWSFSRSSGLSAAQPIRVHHNFARGSYVYDPWYIPGTSLWYGSNMPSSNPERQGARGYAHSGGMGLLSDGGNANDDLLDPAYIVGEDNVLLDMSNYGTGVSSGHDQALRRNLVARSGYIHNFTPNVMIAWAGTPYQIQAYNGNTPARFHDIVLADNISGYTFFNPNSNGAVGTKDMYIDNTVTPATAYTLTNHTNLPIQSRAQIDQMEASWRAATAAQGLLLGAA